LLRAVVRGWRTRLILNRSAKVRLLKDKLKFALPVAAKRLKAELIATVHLELSEGAKLRPRKSAQVLVTRRRALKRTDSIRKPALKTVNIDTYSVTFKLRTSKSQLKRQTLTTPVTPKNRSEAPQLRRQNSLDEFCMLELLSKQLTQSSQPLQIPQLLPPSTTQPPVLTSPTHKLTQSTQLPVLTSPTQPSVLTSPTHKLTQSAQLCQPPLPRKPTQPTQIPQPHKHTQPTNIPQPLLSPRSHKLHQMQSPKPPQKPQQQPKASLKAKVPPKPKAKPKPLSKLESNLPFALRPSPRLKSLKTRDLSAKSSSDSLTRRRSLSKLPAKPTKQQQHTLEAARNLLSSVAFRSFDAGRVPNLV
jgi:hypothetical protein